MLNKFSTAVDEEKDHVMDSQELFLTKFAGLSRLYQVNKAIVERQNLKDK